MIPVTPLAWSNVLADANIGRLAEIAASACRNAQLSNRGDARAAGPWIAATRDLALACEDAARFSPGPGAAVTRSGLQRMARIGRRLLRRSSAHRSTDISSLIKTIDRLERTLATPAPAFAEIEGVELMFGVSAVSLRDEREVVAGDRILAAFAARRTELERISRRSAFGLSDWATRPPADPTMLPASLALTTHPLICWLVVRETLDTLRTAIAQDADAAAAVIVSLLARVPQAAASHFESTVAASRRLHEKLPPGEAARLRLDRYRSVVEGQLRHTAWATLRLRGRLPAGNVLMLGRLRRELEADGSAACAFMARALNEEWRNAGAHEDANWDAETSTLRIGGQSVDPDRLDDSVDIAYAAVYGFECAVAMARRANPQFEEAIGRAAPSPQIALKDPAVRRVFGRRGYAVWRTDWGPRWIEVVLDGQVGVTDVASLLSCVLEAAVEYDVRRAWRIAWRDGRPAVELDARSLSESEQLLPPRRRFVPADVFLPMLAAAALSTGTAPAHCAQGIASVALVDPVLEARAGMGAVIGRNRETGRRLAATLRRNANALEAAWRIVGESAGLEALPGDCRTAADAVVRWTRDGREYDRVATTMNHLLDLSRELPPWLIELGPPST